MISHFGQKMPNQSPDLVQRLECTPERKQKLIKNSPKHDREHYKSAETKAKYVMKNEVSSFETFQMEDYCSEENEEFECVKIHSGTQCARMDLNKRSYRSQ